MGLKKNSPDLEGMSLDDDRDVTVEALQPLLVQTLQDVVSEVWDRHLQRLSHTALPSTTGSTAKDRGQTRDENRAHTLNGKTQIPPNFGKRTHKTRQTEEVNNRLKQSPI